jgi:hypothetical protein
LYSFRRRCHGTATERILASVSEILIATIPIIVAAGRLILNATVVCDFRTFRGNSSQFVHLVNLLRENLIVFAGPIPVIAACLRECRGGIDPTASLSTDPPAAITTRQELRDGS